MGLIKGTTQHKLDVIKTYDPNNPYVIGINGVTDIYIDDEGVEVIEYIIGEIKYTTRLIKQLRQFKPPGVTAININNPSNLTKPYIPGDTNTERLDIIYPTTFEYTTPNTTQYDDEGYFLFKNEVKMGVISTPKIDDQVFIDRKPMAVFESQSRLSNIKSLQDLEEYNNGYYNIIKIE